MTSWPRWISKADQVLLREVAPGLFVGGWRSVRKLPRRNWAAVVDFYGSSGDVSEARHYEVEGPVPRLLRWPFADGDVFPPGALDATEALVRAMLPTGPVLLHCHQGLSRSASAAYGMLRVLGGIPARAAMDRVYVEPGFPLGATVGSVERWTRGRKGASRLIVVR